MTQTTTTHTNTPRRAHPAVVRAALRSRLANNRRTQENHYLDTAALAINNSIKSITYTYNTLDRLTGYADGNTTATYSYDAKQLRQTGQSVNYGTFSLATSTSYNSLGQKSSLTYPDGAKYSYTFDANNQLSSVNLPTGFGSITFNSYTWTVPAQITLPGGTIRNQSYDGLLRLKDLNVKDPGQSQVLSYQYSYDLTSNIVAKATEAGTTNYGYDTLDHLTSATYTGTGQTNETYTYDGIANRITDSKTAAATWVYDTNNQLTSAGTISYTYDANGNTTNQTDSANPANTRNYTYDTDNRLIEVRNSSNALIATYSYDPFGRRLSKDAGTSKSDYFYNEEGLIAEADATGQLTKSYGYVPGSTFSTNPLWQKSGTAYYTYQNDHLGTPMKLLSQSGAVVWSATYDAFGKATVDAGSSISNNLRFPGQYFDAETGLHYNWHRYYFGARYYDPRTSVWQSPDPILGKYLSGAAGRLEQSSNFALYTYGRNNPISYTDPDGREAYGGTRDLAGFTFGVGVHGFSLVVTDNPGKYGSHANKFQQFKNETGEFPGIKQGETFYAAVLSGDRGNDGKLVATVRQDGDRQSINEVTNKGGKSWNKSDLDLNLARLQPSAGKTDFDLEMGMLDSYDQYNGQANYSYVPSVTSGGGRGGSKQTYNSNSFARSIQERGGAGNAPTNFFGQPGKDPGTEKNIPDRYFTNEGK